MPSVSVESPWEEAVEDAIRYHLSKCPAAYDLRQARVYVYSKIVNQGLLQGEPLSALSFIYQTVDKLWNPEGIPANAN